MSILDAIKEAEALAEQTRKNAAKQAREIIGKAEEEVLADREARLSALTRGIRYGAHGSHPLKGIPRGKAGKTDAGDAG